MALRRVEGPIQLGLSQGVKGSLTRLSNYFESQVVAPVPVTVEGCATYSLIDSQIPFRSRTM